MPLLLEIQTGTQTNMGCQMLHSRHLYTGRYHRNREGQEGVHTGEKQDVSRRLICMSSKSTVEKALKQIPGWRRVRLGKKTVKFFLRGKSLTRMRAQELKKMEWCEEAWRCTSQKPQRMTSKNFCILSIFYGEAYLKFHRRDTVPRCRRAQVFLLTPNTKKSRFPAGCIIRGPYRSFSWQTCDWIILLSHHTVYSFKNMLKDILKVCINVYLLNRMSNIFKSKSSQNNCTEDDGKISLQK